MARFAEIGNGAAASPTWDEHGSAVGGADVEPRDWREVDRALRSISVRRGKLDAEELRWVREADALQIWIPLGMVSARDYLERVLGYGPRKAAERLRVAHAIARLPEIAAALDAGELPFSAVRELIRVAQPETESDWLAAARGKSLREIEEAVSGRRPGDRPTDPPKPEATTHLVQFELSAETYALLRQARQLLDDEHGSSLTEDELIAALCGTVLDGHPAAEVTGRARCQVAVTVCERCHQGWQTGAGVQVPIGPAAVERAMCDAQHIGSIDDDSPARAYQDISPAVARLVWRRDGGRCRVPGCRSARNLELHHIVHRADGGAHDASNITLTCGSCHRAHHAGTLRISGTADRLEVHRPAEAQRLSVSAAGNDQGANLNDRMATSQASTHLGTPERSPADRVVVFHAQADVGAPERGSATVTSCAHAEGPRSNAPVFEAPTHVGAGSAQLEALASVDAMESGPVSAPAERVVMAPAYVGALEDGPASTDDERQSCAYPHDRTLPPGALESDERNPITRRGTHAEPRHGQTRRMTDDRATSSISDTIARDVIAPSNLSAAVCIAEAKTALRNLGWKPAIASAAVAAAARALAPDVTLERLIFEALRRCPRPVERHASGGS